MTVFYNCMLVAIGGAIGSLVRYFSSLLFTNSSFPLGTLVSNIVGTFIIGFIMECAVIKVDFPPEMRLLLATGFCGGLTTLSSFIFETDRFVADKSFLMAVLYAIGTLIFAFIALKGGMGVARLIFREAL